MDKNKRVEELKKEWETSDKPLTMEELQDVIGGVVQQGDLKIRCTEIKPA